MTERTERGKRMMEIYRSLNVLVLHIHHGQVLIAENESHLKELEIVLTPEDGWPGSNETNRKAAKNKALSEVPEYTPLVRELEVARKNMAELQSKVQLLKNERRALEWCIRDEYVNTRYSFFQDDDIPDLESSGG